MKQSPPYMIRPCKTADFNRPQYRPIQQKSEKIIENKQVGKYKCVFPDSHYNNRAKDNAKDNAKNNKKRKERAEIKRLELGCIRTRFPLRNSFDDFISGLCSLCSSLKVRALANFGSFIFPRYVVVLFLCVRILQKCRFFFSLSVWNYRI